MRLHCVLVRSVLRVCIYITDGQWMVVEVQSIIVNIVHIDSEFFCMRSIFTRPIVNLPLRALVFV